MSAGVVYFAYGSNMNPRRMHARGVPFVRRTWALLRGYELRFNKRSQADPQRGAANIVPAAAGQVEGVVYELAVEGIERLDEFEGYPLHYTRETVRLELAGSEQAEAIAYVAHASKVDDALLPAADYLAHLLEARDVLSAEYLRMLEEVRTADRS